MVNLKINYKGKELEIEQLPNGKFKKPNIAQFTTSGWAGTWLDNCKIPFTNEADRKKSKIGFTGIKYDTYIKNTDNRDSTNENPTQTVQKIDSRGRFPANLLVSDDVLNYTDSGSFSRYFDLDAWEAQFIITPKPSKSEKNKGLDNFTENQVNDGRNIPPDNAFQRGTTQRKNTHPTVKPVSLFKYLITMGSREGDLILDPFMGSGTTAIACEQIARDWIGIEKEPEYIEIFKARLDSYRNQNKMEEFL